MFVRYYAFLNEPFESVEKALIDLAPIQEIARIVSVDAATGRLSVQLRGAALRKTFVMTFRPPFRVTHRVSLPFTWSSSGSGVFFPTFQGDLEASFWRPGVTQLAVSASYKPPLGPVGRALDRAALHLLAEVVVKDFVDRVAASLEATLVAQHKTA